ncbi:hypothetical protein FMF91_22090 [Salmonella enterica]|nr:hypothetical protein [Salmonella enterica]EAB6539411.1 hypothetical protein [Salmonella enterica subsp. enterica serovar Typhimurium]EBQ6113138.1 hypothetical protein [Salmonella enterica subsp. enterica serovar Enteritidis]ECU6086033.1 hypothetical protein [Salmonella enterica subsp. enterica serovar Kentucky]EEJ1664917.1 hypothetical protein [Salmonella enterica subsp. enterica]TXW18105.1 hypothetical protein D4M59_23310 [Escherichia coli]HBZ0782474.1 hypothetical protein [Klebsiella pne
MAKWPLNQPRSIETSYPPITNGVAPSLLRLDPFSDLSGSIKRLEGGRLENGIYGHSRFCNTDFDDKLACLNLSGV